MPLAILLLAAALAPAAQWTDLNAPSRATVTAVAAQGKALFAGTNTGRIYSSTDAGAHWSPLLTQERYPVLSFLVEGKSIIALRSKVPSLGDCFSTCNYPNYRPDAAISHDGGKTWAESDYHLAQRLARGPDSTLWGFSMDSVLYQPGGKGGWASQPYRFAPGAAPWGFGIRCSAAAFAEDRLFAIFNDRLYTALLQAKGAPVEFSLLSEEKALGLATFGITCLASFPSGLKRWHVLDKSLLPEEDRRPLLGWMSQQDSIFLGFSADGKRLLRSLDQGFTWTQVGPDRSDTGSWAAEGRGSWAVLSGWQGNLSVTSGAAWAPSMDGMSETEVSPLLAADGSVTASTWLGVQRRAFQGGGWAAFPNPTGAAPQFMARTRDALWLAGTGLFRIPSDDTAHWASRPYTNITAMAASGNRVVAALSDPAPGPLVVDGNAGEHRLLICDGGAPCRETPPGRFRFDRVGLEIFGGGGSYPRVYWEMKNLAVGDDAIFASDDFLYRSKDGGNTWDTLGPGALALAFANGRLLEAVSNGSGCEPCLAVSADLGGTWKSYPGPWVAYIKPLRGLAGLGGRFYLANDSAVFASEDGLTWSDMGLPAGSHPASLTGDAGHLVVGTAENRLLVAALPSPAVAVRRAPAGGAGMRKVPRSGWHDAEGRARDAVGRATVTPM